MFWGIVVYQSKDVLIEVYEGTFKLFQLLRSTLEMGGGGKDGPISVCFYSKQFKVCGLGYCGLVVRLQDLQSQGCGFNSYMYQAIS